MTQALQARWERLWQALGTQAPPGLSAALLAAYCEPQRHYHTLQHLEECFTQLDALYALAQPACAVELALWFHDAVYDVHGHDNEARSADWARRALTDAGLPSELVEHVCTLIMATCHDAAPPDAHAALLTDVDLSILAAAPARFAEYEAQIRAEYAHVPESLFRDKRREVLQGFLDRDRIYQTQAGRDRFEAAARRNLALALGLNQR